MIKKLALTIPGYGQVQTPENIPSGTNAPSNILQFGINFLFLAVLTAALIFTLWGGVTWITSGGDKQKIDKAKKTITYAIVGILIAVFAFVIIQTLGQILSIPFLKTIGT